MATQAHYHDEKVPKLPREPTSADCGLADSVSFFEELQEDSRDQSTGIDSIPDDRLGDTLALVLTEFCSTGPEPVGLPHPSDPAALFFSPYKQIAFSLNFYCKRLLEYTCCSKSCFVIAILYLVRLAERCPIFELNDYNVHRLMCTAVVIAAKWLDDISYSNAHYARVGGIQNANEMSRLEEHMLRALDYKLFITKENYEEVERHLVLIALNCL